MGIPIAGENVGDSDKGWGSDESEQQEEEYLSTVAWLVTVNDEAAIDLAFSIRPIKDGMILDLSHPSPPTITPNYYEPTNALTLPSTVYQCINTVVATSTIDMNEKTPSQPIRRTNNSSSNH
jgi:hypothetical protein